jgi:flagellar protein FliO/FliZ
MMISRIFSRLLPAMTLCAPALAQAEKAAEQQKAAINVTGGSYIEVIVGLGIVLALIYILAFFARRLNGVAYSGKVPMKILGGVSLGTRERAVLVEVGGKHLLLGVAPGRVSTLHVFDAPLDMQREKRAEAAFADRLKQILSQGENNE